MNFYYIRLSNTKKKKMPVVFLPGEVHGPRSLTGYTVYEIAKSWTPE